LRRDDGDYGFGCFNVRQSCTASYACRCRGNVPIHAAAQWRRIAFTSCTRRVNRYRHTLPIPSPREHRVPYSSIEDLPAGVRNTTPKHAQEIYKEAFNSAWDEYKNPDDRRGDASREETAHRVAWAAVKQKYEKGEDERWHAK